METEPAPNPAPATPTDDGSGVASAAVCSPPAYLGPVDTLTQAQRAQRLAAILRAEATPGNDLHVDEATYRLVVCAEDEDGNRWGVGHVDLGVAYELKRQNRPYDLHRLISRVKFGWMDEPLEENGGGEVGPPEAGPLSTTLLAGRDR